jgi:putative ABC transport system permease protein
VSVSNAGIMSSAYSFTVSIEGAPESWGPPHVSTVSASFLDTMGIPILAGRGFNSGDRKGSPVVSVVNETFARAYFPGVNALGQHFTVPDDPTPITVVGIMRDFKFANVRSGTPPTAYVAFEQFPTMFYQMYIRLDGSAKQAMPLLSNVLADLTPNRRALLSTLDEILNGSIPKDIWLARLTGLFGAMALALACFGVYGVISYLVVSRTSEIGIRLAVGAPSGRVLRQVIGDALITIAPGLILGIGVAISAERLVASMLFNFKAHDPITYGAVAGALILTTILAAYVPARRASKIDPVDALRCE